MGVFFLRERGALHSMGALCHPTRDAHSVTRTPMRGPAFGGGGRWSRDARLVCPELYLARIILESASQRGMTRVPPRPRCGAQLLEVAVGGVGTHGLCVLSYILPGYSWIPRRGAEWPRGLLTRDAHMSPRTRCGVQRVQAEDLFA